MATKRLGNEILIISIVIVIVFITVPSVYFFNFHGDLSSDPSEFGAIGDYFNGILSPFLTLANFIVFIRLSIVLNRYNHNVNENTNNLSKKLAWYQVKYEEFKYFRDSLDREWNTFLVPTDYIDKRRKFLVLHSWICNNATKIEFAFPEVKSFEEYIFCLSNGDQVAEELFMGNENGLYDLYFHNSQKLVERLGKSIVGFV